MSGNEQLTIEAAERVHDAQITTFAISVGNSIRYFTDLFQCYLVQVFEWIPFMCALANMFP